MASEKELVKLHQSIIQCDLCPRLVTWRKQVAQEKVKRFAEEEYWGKPIPGFGDPRARLVIVGLAPAAHGANRTGRMFTGDRSGDWLFRSLHRFGFANQPNASHRHDGLTLRDCYITAALHCAPPQNKPTADEKANCFTFLEQELVQFSQIRVIVALGKIAFDTVLKCCKKMDWLKSQERPVFSHDAEYTLRNDVKLIASYHPSQQNTFTRKLTEPMFDAIFARAMKHIAK